MTGVFFATFFAVTGVWFWLVLAALCIFDGIYILNYKSESDVRLFGPLVPIVIFLLCVVYGNGLHPVLWIKQHWILAISLFFAYFLIGAAWAVFRFWELVRCKTAEFARILKLFEDSGNSNLASIVRSGQAFKEYSQEREWTSFLRDYWKDSRWGGPESAPINYREHTMKLSSWIMYWPFSFVWTILGDYLLRISDRIIEALQVILRAIANRAARSYGIEPTKGEWRDL